MTYENISASMPGADLKAIIAAIDLIKSKIPVMVNLSEDDRKEIFKMGDRSFAFVTKVYDYSKTNPGFMPADVSIPEFHKDYLYSEALRVIQQSLAPLLAGLNDTEMAAGSEAFRAANWFYGGVRDATKRNAPFARGIYEDLRTRYPGIKPGDAVTPDEPTA